LQLKNTDQMDTLKSRQHQQPSSNERVPEK